VICDATATSPCVGVCELDQASGLCRGCLRTLQEIARWGGLSAVERRMIKASLAERRCAVTAKGAPSLVVGA
jgi:predicted Fe-S protein YdhL (DUF1289 family)